MKNLLFFVFLWVSATSATAQDKIIFTDVVEVPGANKDVLYNRALEWFNNNFNNPNFVMQLTDSENGKIFAKTNIPYDPSKFSMGGIAGARGKIDFNIKLYFKDERFKYELTDFEHIPYTNGAKSFGILTTDENSPITSYGGMKKRASFLWEDLKSLATATGNSLAQSLTENLKKESESENEDW